MKLKYQVATELVPLTDKTLHIHWIDLDCCANHQNALTEDELIRARRMHKTLHQQRFINARGYLRQCLAHYLNQEASNIQLASTDKGKLFIADSIIKFNLAHSQNIAVFAFNFDHDIGIDVEHIRTLDDLHAIAQRVFNATELSYLAQLSEQDRLQGFFKLWARKEAVIKASGDGMSADLTNIITTHQSGDISENIEHIVPMQLKLYDIPAQDTQFASAIAMHPSKQVVLFNR